MMARLLRWRNDMLNARSDGNDVDAPKPNCTVDTQSCDAAPVTLAQE